MELLNDDISKLEIGKSLESFQKYMDLQRDLFHSQIEQMQRIVVTQCKLTGVNPLAQEMAAGALSIKIGKRPRDLLNPKAVKYMQSVFSIKDAISKKESREISALFGVKLTQVREFFNTQRSRVRRLVRLSTEKSIGSNACKDQDDGGFEPTMPIDPVPLNSIGPAPVEDGPSCSTQDNNLPGIDDLDKEFVRNIFNLMRKEETFSGQVKLLEWILQIQDSSVLCWFLTDGGVMILATWLSQAAFEEQTTILHIILKVLCHLPLHKSLPVHMSAVLQSVNKLRFYRNADISNRAKVLLSRWSKLFARTQALKKPNGSKALSDSQTELILRQSIGEIMHDQHWQSNIDVAEDIAIPSLGSSESSRKLESHQALKLLTASSDDSNRKNLLGVSQIRKRRKVQMVEQPGQTMAARSLQAPKSASLNQGRPLSADDIQKAKMRAQFMQSKYGKTVPPNGNAETKTEGLIRHLLPSSLPSVSKVPSHNNYPEVEELKMPLMPPCEAINQVETPPDPQIKGECPELLIDNCTKFQIPWRTPPELKLNDIWRVGAGENSKENEAQCNRNRREKEVFYQKFLDIPSNPKDPWDIEMDYDDSLTVEILTEQLPETEGAERLLTENQAGNVVPSVPPPSLDVNMGTAEPDLELLAVLLKNPELVFALTSGQAGNLSSGETVKLLDLIKTGGSALMNGLNGFGRKDQEKVEVSLPSPTPSSNAGTSGWKSETSKNPFSQHSLSNQVANFRTDSCSSILPHNSAISISQNQNPTTMAPFSHHFVAPKTHFPPQQTDLPERLRVSAVHTLHHNLHMNPPTLQMPELVMPVKNVPSTSFPFFSQSASPSHRVEAAARSKPITSNLPDRSALSFHLPVQSKSQSITPGLSTHLNSRPQGLDSWRGMRGIVPSPHSQAKRNEFDASNGGRTVQLHIPPANFERNQYAKEDEFESWSPENSPGRIPEYMHQQSSRMYRPEQVREPDLSRFREENRTGKGWRDRR